MKKTMSNSFWFSDQRAFLWLSFRNANLQQVFDIIKNVNVKLLLIPFAISVIGLMLRSYRWKTIGEGLHRYPVD